MQGADAFDVIVIGAGFAGLATAAALRASGVRSFAVLEQGEGVGHFWTKTYDRIHLHSADHDLPQDGGTRRGLPRHLSRDALLGYFRAYAAHHGLAPHLRFGTRVERLTRVPPDVHDGRGWRFDTPSGSFFSRYAVVATAVNRVPKEVVIPDAESFRGRRLHSAAYRNGAAFRGRRVLVVGSGNSAAEISLDLVEHGADRVAMWVRGPRHFLPLSRMTLMFRAFRLLGLLSPARLDAAHRLTVGTPEFEAEVRRRDALPSLLSVDLSRFGIRKPAVGPMVETFTNGRIPVFDVGTIREIRRGRIEVIDGNVRALESFEPNGMRFTDGVEPFDDVILATGFEPRLEEFVHLPELLGSVRWHETYPLTDGRSRSRVVSSIFFPGFDPAVNGGLSLGRWGWEAGERIAEEFLGGGVARAAAASPGSSEAHPSDRRP